MLTKDGWKLSASVQWEPLEYDEEVTCLICRGSGKGFSWDEYNRPPCYSCEGIGFRYTNHPRGQQPPVDPELMRMLQAAYQEWLKLSSSSP
jgi:hypothetical protein